MPSYALILIVVTNQCRRKKFYIWDYGFRKNINWQKNYDRVVNERLASLRMHCIRKIPCEEVEWKGPRALALGISFQLIRDKSEMREKKCQISNH